MNVETKENGSSTQYVFRNVCGKNNVYVLFHSGDHTNCKLSFIYGAGSLTGASEDIIKEFNSTAA